MPIDRFFKMLKVKKQWTIRSVVEEEILGTFKQANEDQLENLNVDFETITKNAEMHFETKNEDSNKGRRNRHAFNVLKRNGLNIILNESQRVNKFYRKAVMNGQYTDDAMIRLFRQWAAAVNEFLQRPQRKTYGVFRNKVVTSEPDIHFVQTFTPFGADGSPVLIMNWEVKRKDPPDKRRPMKTWIEKIVSSHVLGKIGRELLIESYGLFFSPYAVGMACLRSEIMFLFFNISIEHFDAISENSFLDGKQASIHYTKTYDILKPRDRSEIMDIMFYMAATSFFLFK